MGNKITRRRPVVDERYTRPQGLYQHRDVDHRKLRRLILDAKLAPCFPGAEDLAADLDECPICFLFYPSLNRSKCCTKGICTECFLQMKSPHTARPTQCPFCKTPNYAVEYRGAKTLEEKGVEQAEEQKVIEAKIRIRQKELQDEEERMLRREEDIREGRIPAASELLRRNFSNLNGFTLPPGSEEEDEASTREMVPEAVVEGDLNTGVEESQPGLLQASSALISVPARNLPRAHVGPGSDGGTFLHGQGARVQGSSFTRFNRDDEFDLDLEDIMVMEAIWLSIQEQGQQQQEPVLAAHGNLGISGYTRSDTNQNSSSDNDRDTISHAPVSGDAREVPGRSSVTGGLAGAIAALAERQALSVESPVTRQISPSDQISQNDLASSENDGASMDTINSSNGAPLMISESQDENDVGDAGEVPSTHTTPSRSCTQLDRDGEPEGERRGNMEDKSETEEGREQPAWMESQAQDGGQGLNSWIEVSLESGRALSPHIREESRGSISEWMLDHSSEAVEVGTSFSSSIPSASELPWECEAPDILPPQNAEGTVDPPGFTPPPPMLPESFEEQMMLAMALSLAEAQAQSRRI